MSTPEMSTEEISTTKNPTETSLEQSPADRQAYYDAEEITTSELRATMAEVISRVAFGEDRYLVTRNGEPVAGIIPLHMLEKLVEWEDAQLDEEVQKARKEYEQTGKRTRR